ncbi:unnamed protein product, partial [Pleuronectes platessa]
MGVALLSVVMIAHTDGTRDTALCCGRAAIQLLNPRTAEARRACDYHICSLRLFVPTLYTVTAPTHNVLSDAEPVPGLAQDDKSIPPSSNHPSIPVYVRLSVCKGRVHVRMPVHECESVF